MVGFNAHVDVALGIVAAQAGRVTVDGFAERFGIRDFHHHVGIFIQHAGKIHHLGQVANVAQPQQIAHVFYVDHGSGGFKRCGRYAGRGTKAEFKRGPFGIGKHVFYPRHAQHVADLVGVRHSGDGSVNHGQPSKLDGG